MGFPRQEYWRDLPFPSSGDICNPGIESVSPALAGRFFTTEPPGNSLVKHYPFIIFRTDAVFLLLLFFFFYLCYFILLSICGQEDSIMILDKRKTKALDISKDIIILKGSILYLFYDTSVTMNILCSNLDHTQRVTLTSLNECG